MKDWLYWLLEEDGRSQYVEDGTNAVSSTVDKKPLRYTPDAWQDISLAFERDKKRLGWMRKVPIPIGFVLDGARILRNAVYRSGLGKKLFLLITRRTIDFSEDPDYFKDYHTMFSKHGIEFVKQKDDEHKYNVTLTDIGLARQLELNEDTKYAFKLSDPEAVTIRYTGMKLYNAANYVPTQDVEIDSQVYNWDVVAPITFVNEDGNSFGAAFFSQSPQSIPNATRGAFAKFIKESDNYGLSVDEGSAPITFTITGKIKIMITQNVNNGSLAFRLYSNFRPENYVGVPPAQAPIVLGGTNGTGYKEVPVNVSVTVQPGEHVFLVNQFFSLVSTSYGFKYHFLEGGELKFSYSNTHRTTNVRAYEPFVLLDKILERISGKRGKCVSDLLNTPKYKGYLLTSGDGLRGLPDAEVKLSFNEWFDIYYVNTFGSMEINKDTLKFEVIDYFFGRNETPIDLGDVGSCFVDCPEYLLGNTIKIGHKVKEIEGLNGKMSFNNTHTYSTPADEVKSELEFVSPAIADPYSAEHTRAGFDGKTTTDSNKDNDLFLLICEADAVSFTAGSIINNTLDNFLYFNHPTAFANKEFFVPGARFQLTGTVLNNGTYTVKAVVSGVGDEYRVIVQENVVAELISTATVQFTLYKLKRYNWTSVVGVPADAGIFNTDVTPKRLLLLWQRWFNSVLWKRDGKIIKFETTEQNKDLELTIGGVTIKEKDDVAITDEIMWIPFNFNINTLVPTDIFNTLDARPNAPFVFNWNDAQMKGIMWVGGVMPDNNKPQSYKLLCSPDCNLIPLID